MLAFVLTHEKRADAWWHQRSGFLHGEFFYLKNIYY